MDGITRDELVACAERELALRIRFYPKWAAAGRMSEEKAEREIALQREILRVLRGGTKTEAQQIALTFPKVETKEVGHVVGGSLRHPWSKK
jgi:hypothetical protein